MVCVLQNTQNSVIARCCADNDKEIDKEICKEVCERVPVSMEGAWKGNPETQNPESGIANPEFRIRIPGMKKNY